MQNEVVVIGVVGINEMEKLRNHFHPINAGNCVVRRTQKCNAFAALCVFILGLYKCLSGWLINT